VPAAERNDVRFHALSAEKQSNAALASGKAESRVRDLRCDGGWFGSRNESTKELSSSLVVAFTCSSADDDILLCCCDVALSLKWRN